LRPYHRVRVDRLQACRTTHLACAAAVGASSKSAMSCPDGRRRPRSVLSNLRRPNRVAPRRRSLGSRRWSGRSRRARNRKSGSTSRRAGPETCRVVQHFEAQRFEERDGGRRHASPSPNSFVGAKTKTCEALSSLSPIVFSGHKMVLMPTEPCLAYFTLPLVAGSEIRPTSLRVSSRRTVGYK
jgi:hypothetical protein